MKKLLSLIIFLLLIDFGLSAQTYNDGPIQLRSRVREVNLTYTASDQGAFGVGFIPDEITFKIWGRDNANLDGSGWLGGTCLLDNYNPPGISTDFNYEFFNHTYAAATVPQFLDIKVEAWQDNCGSDGALGFNCPGTRCTYETNCCCARVFGSCVVSSSDKEYCDADPFYSNLDYRTGPPCEWYNHGQLSGNCPGNKYNPVIETYWSYTLGSGFNSAIDLGTLTSGVSFSHYNSNVCYSNNYPSSGGNDVFYQFTINNPIGVRASLCGVQGAQFDSYIYIVNGDQVTVESFNDNACTDQSETSTFLCSPGTYYIVVDAVSAAQQGTFTLNVSEDTSFVFEASISKEDISCNGLTDGTAKVNIIGGVAPHTISWSVSASTNDSIFGLAAGNVMVTVTDADNCQVTDMITIIEPSPVSVNVTSTDVSCSGANDGTATAVASGGTPNPNVPSPNDYNYSWNTIPQQNLQTAVFLGAGSYSVVVTDDNGCVATGSTTISASTQIIVNTDSFSNVSCFGNDDGYIQVSVNGGVTPYTFTWSNALTTPTAANLPPGNYDVTVYDADNCNVVESYVVTEPDSLKLFNNNTFDATCYDESDGVIDVSTSGGTLPYVYTWSNGTMSEDLINVDAGAYILTVYDANGCVDILSAIINQPDEIDITFTSTDPSCFGDEDGTMSVSASGGTPNYIYTWSDFVMVQNRNNVGAGLYSVFVRDLNNCIAIDSVRLSTAPEIIIEETVTGASCNGAQDGAINIDVAGGVPPYTYLWSDGVTTEDRSNISGGVYTLTVTDQENCSAEITAIVEEQGVLDMTLIGIDVRCQGDSDGRVEAVISGGVPPFNFNWSVSGVSANVLTGLSGGNYSLTLTDGNGCSAIDSVTISEPTALEIFVDSIVNATCFGGEDGSVSLSASGGEPPYEYSVFTNVFQSSSEFTDLSAGLYGAIVLDQNDCFAQQDFTISENDPFEFNFESIYFITRGSSIVLEPELSPEGLELTYSWSPTDGLSCIDCPNPEASPVLTTNYTVIGTDSLGCTYETTTSVYVKNEFEIFIPNAFSPNGDGNNDEFKLLDFGSVDHFEFKVFNRTGELVFQTEDITKTWDGTYKGKLLNPDVYVYHISGVYINTEEFDFQGSITLIK